MEGVTNMKKLSHSRANLILLILMSMWTTLILFIQAIPSLKLILRVSNKMIEEISYGYGSYADEMFIQTDIIYPIVYNAINVLTLACTTIFSIISIFKPKMTKLLGITIIVQNTFSLALKGWDKFLINKLDNTILIDIKMFLVIVSFVTIIFVLFSFKQKILYLILGTITLLQCLNTISFLSEYIRSINNIYIILECFCMILVLILYWIILFLQIKTTNRQQAQANN